MSTSRVVKVMSGVPQGTVLGPTLFVLYINELPTVIQSECRLFADDTNLFHEVKSDDDTPTMQDDLDKLADWSSKWLLKYNINKCNIMHCGQANPHLDLHLAPSDTYIWHSLSQSPPILILYHHCLI